MPGSEHCTSLRKMRRACVLLKKTAKKRLLRHTHELPFTVVSAKLSKARGMAFIVNTPLGFQPTHRATNLSQVEHKSGTEARRAAYKEKPGAFTKGWKNNYDYDAKEALLELARKKRDSVTEAIVRTRLDLDGVYDEHARSVAERRLLRAAADAAAAPPVDLSKLALVRTLEGHSDMVRCGVRFFCSTFVMMCLRRRSMALRCLRRGGASCLRRTTRRSRCGTWRPVDAWRRWKGTRASCVAASTLLL